MYTPLLRGNKIRGILVSLRWKIIWCVYLICVHLENVTQRNLQISTAYEYNPFGLNFFEERNAKQCTKRYYIKIKSNAHLLDFIEKYLV